MTWPQQKKAWHQRRKRRQKHEPAFLFTAEGHLLLVPHQSSIDG
jgi:hypothetical protein